MAWEYYMGSLRWVHVIAGITWIGLLYYFNFVQTTSFPKMEGGSRRDAFVNLVPTALWWFRWSALVTMLAGSAWIVSYGIGGETVNASGGWDLYVETARFKSIMVGCGPRQQSCSLNVWLIIWPTRRSINRQRMSPQSEKPRCPRP